MENGAFKIGTLAALGYVGMLMTGCGDRDTSQRPEEPIIKRVVQTPPDDKQKMRDARSAYSAAVRENSYPAEDSDYGRLEALALQWRNTALEANDFGSALEASKALGDSRYDKANGMKGTERTRTYQTSIGAYTDSLNVIDRTGLGKHLKNDILYKRAEAKVKVMRTDKLATDLTSVMGDYLGALAHSIQAGSNNREAPIDNLANIRMTQLLRRYGSRAELALAAAYHTFDASEKIG